MKFSSILWLFATYLLSLTSVVKADYFDSLLNSLGLQTFEVITQTPLPYSELENVCSSTVITGNNALGGYAATGYAVWESTTSGLGFRKYAYSLYWYFSYDNPINAESFDIYGSSDWINNGDVYVDLSRGAFLLEYQDSITDFLGLQLECLDPSFLFEFEADTPTIFDKNYIISMSGTTANQLISVAACGTVTTLLPDIYAACDTVDVQMCSPYGADNCDIEVPPPNVPSPSLSASSSTVSSESATSSTETTSDTSSEAPTSVPDTSSTEAPSSIPDTSSSEAADTSSTEVTTSETSSTEAPTSETSSSETTQATSSTEATSATEAPTSETSETAATSSSETTAATSDTSVTEAPTSETSETPAAPSSDETAPQSTELVYITTWIDDCEAYSSMMATSTLVAP